MEVVVGRHPVGGSLDKWEGSLLACGRLAECCFARVKSGVSLIVIVIDDGGWKGLMYALVVCIA